MICLLTINMYLVAFPGTELLKLAISQVIKSNKGGLSWWLSGQEPACQCRRHRFNSWSRKIPHVAEQLNSGTTTTEAVLLSPGTTTTEAHAPESLCSATRSHCKAEARAPQLT